MLFGRHLQWGGRPVGRPRESAGAGKPAGRPSARLEPISRFLYCFVLFAGICRGEGALLADPAKVQALEGQLGALAPQLAALSEALRRTLLPALPSLAAPAAARLQV